jgi:hypothetical protein
MAKAYAIGLWFLAVAGSSFADLNVVREVVITPKGVNAAANIGAVNRSPRVRLASAQVDINVGPPGGGTLAPIDMIVKASFELENQSSKKLRLTVGFPVSNSSYSSYELEFFRVITDGSTREVFRRKTSYPRNLIHEYVSGVKGPVEAVPPADIDRETMKLTGEQFVGQETFQNLMVWEEKFAPHQKKRVEVQYELQIPLQENRIVGKKTEGNYKGIWPHEANNIPLAFLETLPKESFYFFDYYLKSGASWAGPIGREEITVRFGPEWQGHDFHTSATKGISMSGGVNAGPGAPTMYYFTLRNEEPAENLYFAVRPGAARRQP